MFSVLVREILIYRSAFVRALRICRAWLVIFVREYEIRHCSAAESKMAADASETKRNKNNDYEES